MEELSHSSLWLHNLVPEVALSWPQDGSEH